TRRRGSAFSRPQAQVRGSYSTAPSASCRVPSWAPAASGTRRLWSNNRKSSHPKQRTLRTRPERMRHQLRHPTRLSRTSPKAPSGQVSCCQLRRTKAPVSSFCRDLASVPRTHGLISCAPDTFSWQPAGISDRAPGVRFVDECVVRLEAGDGGNGCAAFRREANVPLGGPSGGDGGRGGSVIFVGDEGRNSLLDLKHLRILRAERGEHGKGRDKYGHAGADQIVRVPLGTMISDDDPDEILGEILGHQHELIGAQGGQGGRGNKHFSTPIDRAPKKAEPGTPGVTRNVRLELKVMADVGLLGFPNVGKSTFIDAVSRARPKIADYPFTTLVPQLGVVKLDEWMGADDAATLVVADIAGRVPGASDGAGLGVRCPKHGERRARLLPLARL